MQIDKSISLITNYCYQEDLSTYDPYDIWQTISGQFIKLQYNRFPKLFLPAAVTYTIWDTFLNNGFRINYNKKEYPIVRALSALSLLNLDSIKPEDKNKHYILQHINWLLNYSTKLEFGIGWGLPFDWPATKDIIYKKDTPFSTHTPYVFEAIYNMYQKEPNKYYLNTLHSIYAFFEHDIKIMYEDSEKMAISYGPVKDRIAINAVSYALLMYSYFIHLFPSNKSYLLSKARKLYNYIKFFQGSEGEWYYSPDKSKSFIDCFHSCFIIQNLFKSKCLIPELVDDSVINSGWDYIKGNFYDDRYGLYRRFSKRNKPGILVFDLYDNAEVLHTSILLNDYDTQKDIDKSIQLNFFKNRHIYSGITICGNKVNRNTLRWAIMPLLYAYSLKLTKDYVWNIRNN